MRWRRCWYARVVRRRPAPCWKNPEARKLAAELNISVPPVSEALQRLEREGLLESKPRVGTRVRIPTPQDIEDRCQVRERAANLFYSDTVHSSAAHRVDQCLDLAAAVPGTNTRFRDFPLPAGRPEGELPAGDFVLASPVAGWRGKQWPLEFYAALAVRLRRELNLPLVWNVPSAGSVPAIEGVGLHVSSLEGLIWATRRATAIVGVDSGPMHLAAALAKPGVAIFGPTDPARNGPYQAGAGLRVLRDAGAVTSYQRGDTIDDSMRRISPDQVFETLREALGFAA